MSLEILHDPADRPSWANVFLAMAFAIARRSHDTQTQHGCVLATRKNRVLGVGFNGFPRDLDDHLLPSTRPDKYPWMRHAERNAVANCARKPRRATAYVTGEPCNDCLMDLWQNGVERVVYARGHGSHDQAAYDPRVRQRFLEQVERRGFRLEVVDPDLSWLKGGAE